MRRAYHPWNGMGGLRSRLSLRPHRERQWSLLQNKANRLHIRSTDIFGDYMNFPLLFSQLEVSPCRLNHRLVMDRLYRPRRLWWAV